MLAPALLKAKTLAVLDLRANAFTGRGLRAVTAAAVRGPGVLAVLDVRGNAGVAQDELVAEAARMHHAGLSTALLSAASGHGHGGGGAAGGVGATSLAVAAWAKRAEDQLLYGSEPEYVRPTDATLAGSTVAASLGERVLHAQVGHVCVCVCVCGCCMRRCVGAHCVVGGLVAAHACTLV